MVELTYPLLAKMFRCPDCVTDPRIEVKDVFHKDGRPCCQRITTLHAPSCVSATKRFIDDDGNHNVLYQFQIAYMPYQVADDDLILTRLH